MTVDGLGFEEVNQSVTNTALISGTNIYGAGSVVTPKLEGTTFASTTANITTGQVYRDLTVGSSIVQSTTWNNGNLITALKAETVISGGMWVMGSAAAATSGNVVLKPVGAAIKGALGVCVSTTQSGAAAPILTRGIYNGLIAEETIVTGAEVGPGGGGASNTIGLAKAGSCRGIALMGAGSEGAATVYLF